MRYGPLIKTTCDGVGRSESYAAVSTPQSLTAIPAETLKPTRLRIRVTLRRGHYFLVNAQENKFNGVVIQVQNVESACGAASVDA